MPIVDVFETIRTDPKLEELTRLLARGKGAVAAEGLWGSSAPILAALAAERLGRPLLLVTAHADEADDIRDDVETAVGAAPELLPQLDTLPQDAVGPDELADERLRLCLGLMQRATASPPLLVAPIMALMQPVPTAEAIRARSYAVATGQTLDPDALTRWLTDHGFQRCDAVDVSGDFARRGGIVDVFSSAHVEPVRIEFFGDEVASIRLIDTGTQRSSHALDGVQIPALSWSPQGPGGEQAADPVGGSAIADATTSFLRLLPPDTLIAFHEPGEIQELGRTYLQRLGERRGIIHVDAVFRQANEFAQLHLHRFTGTAADAVRFDVTSLPPFEAKAAEALQMLDDLAQKTKVLVLCDNPPEEQRLRELLDQQPAADVAPAAPAPQADAAPAAPSLHDRVRTAIGVIHRGFQWQQTAYVPHHELFHRYRQRRTLRRVQPARPLDSFFDLEAGDYVVHTIHGIGRFRGLKTLDREGRVDEYLAIEFADQAIVHVPISQIHVVQKSPPTSSPSRLSGRWRPASPTRATPTGSASSKAPSSTRKPRTSSAPSTRSRPT